MTKRVKYKCLRKVFIYEIICRETDERFIGSCLDLVNPLWNQRNDCESEQIISRGSFYYEILDTFLCRYELSRLLKLQYFLETRPNINVYRAYVYFQKRKLTQERYEYLIIYRKEMNKEYKCPCGGIYKGKFKKQHFATLRHKNYEVSLFLDNENKNNFSPINIK